MYTSSILTVDDVKLDFIKNNHEYFFVNKIENVKTYSYYCPCSKVIFYNSYVFIPSTENINILKLSDKNTEAKATCVSLFLTFHEDCGHLKYGINNIEDTPRQFYSSDLDIKKGGVPDINDSGYIFEYFLNKNIIHVKYFMRSNNILEINSLLEYKYYINSDFEKLKKILDNILPNNSNKIFKSKKKKKEL